MRIDQPQLFLKKLARLLGVTVVLVPLIHFKLLLPTYLYVITLLLLHVYILYVYGAQTNWRLLRHNRTGFALRLLGIALFAYILTLLHFQGTAAVVLLNLSAAVAAHAVILLLLMVTPKRSVPGSNSSAQGTIL